MTDLSRLARKLGRIVHVDSDNRYAFIAPDSGGRDVFVGGNIVEAMALVDGERVEYAPVVGARGRRPFAADVRRVTAS